jgi:NarL family two-component system response regulator LiaR
MERVTVLIADDHALLREGTRELLRQDPCIQVVAEASDGEEAVALVSLMEPDVAIVDIAMPKVDGIEATKRIKASRPDTKVLMLSAYEDDDLLVDVIESGADGYLLKTARGHELVAAIRALHSGGTVLHPVISRRVLERISENSHAAASDPPLRVLTDRETRILRLAAQGLSNKEIAGELGLGRRTVEANVGRILRKLGVKSRTTAVVTALKRGWVTIDDMPSRATQGRR